MEGDLIKINEWLLPVAWLYGIRRKDSQRAFRNGNPEIQKLRHTRYFGRQYHRRRYRENTTYGISHPPVTKRSIKVAVLSRGYKRKSKGFILATSETSMPAIGDEPYQMKQKFPDVYVAVDKKPPPGN